MYHSFCDRSLFFFQVPISPRFSSISSQDSGFTSQDAIYHALRRQPSPQPVQASKQVSYVFFWASTILTGRGEVKDTWQIRDGGPKTVIFGRDERSSSAMGPHDLGSSPGPGTGGL